MEYQIDKQFFNPLFFKIYNDIKTGEHKRWLLNYGGAGAGKSVSQFQIEILLALEKKGKILVIRKTAASNTDSTIPLVKQILDDWEISYTQNKVEKRITLKNGSEFIFKGIDNPEKLKSIHGITRIVVEEASELDENDVNQLNARLRGHTLKNAQIVLLFNPVSDQIWIYKWFWERKDRTDFRVYHSTYLSNNFLDEEYKNQLEDYKNFSPLYYRVLCLGEFGLIETGNECYRFPSVENQERQKNYSYDPTQPIILSIDKNNNPYCAVVLSQQKEDGVLYIFDEIALEGKNFEEVAGHFAAKYYDHQSGLIITGDSTIKQDDALLRKGYNGFIHLRELLKEFNPVLRNKTKNESVYMRILFINKLFAEGRLVINEKCKKTLHDIQGVPFDKNGHEKDKSYTTKKLANGTVLRFEKWGHLSDVVDYSVGYAFDREYQLFKNKTKTLQNFRTDGGREIEY